MELLTEGKFSPCALSSRLKDLLGPVTRVKKKKKCLQEKAACIEGKAPQKNQREIWGGKPPFPERKGARVVEGGTGKGRALTKNERERGVK